ncbi:MAG: hypothetical protein S4CHLAM37_09610 [Chlamydiia bacterium]|nr:hypothetical protein [Chlamydiia bacterium]
MSGYLKSVFGSSAGKAEQAGVRPTLEMAYDDLFAKTNSFAKDVIKQSSLSKTEMSTFEELQLEFVSLQGRKDGTAFLDKSILIERIFTLIHGKFKSENEVEEPIAKPAPKAKASEKRRRVKASKKKAAEASVEKEPAKAKEPSKTTKPSTLKGIVRHNNNCCFISAYQLLKRVRGIFDALPDTLDAWKEFSGNDRTLRSSLQKVDRCTLNTKSSSKQEDAFEVIQNLLNQINYPYPLRTTDHITYDVSGLGLQLLKDENEKSEVKETHAILPLALKSGKSTTFKKAFNGFFENLDHVTQRIGGLKKPGSDVLEGGVEIESLEHARKIRTKPPRELLLSFGRFKPVGSKYEKNNTRIKDVPIDLKLEDSIFEKASDNKREYNLKGAIIHSGSMSSGHYTTLIQDKGSWFLCDDDQISALELSQVKDILEHAYVLHYSSSK